MKTRIHELIVTYYEMRNKARSKIKRELLQNVIDDLEAILQEAQ